MYFFDFFAYIIYQILQLYKYGVIIYVILSMLVSFNVINYNNKLVSIIMDSLYKIIEPLLRRIRKFLPNFGAIDLSPVLLIILIEGLQFVITKYGL